MKTPECKDFVLDYAKRVAEAEILPEESESISAAQVCQFLSTLIAIDGSAVLNVPKDTPWRVKLVERCRDWHTRFKGQFAATPAERCLDQLDPKGSEGVSMQIQMIGMQLQLTSGVAHCLFQKCKETQKLMQCSK